MSVSPQEMLEKLRNEQLQQQVEPQQIDSGAADPTVALEQLRTEKTNNPENFEKPAETKVKKNILGKMFDAMKTPSLSGSTFKFIAGGFLDDEGNVVTNVEGTPKDILVNRGEASIDAFTQGAKETAQGAVQMSFDVLEGAGIAPEGLTQYYTKLSDDQRKQFEEDFNKEFGHVGKFAFSRGTGKMLPIIAMSPLGAGKTIATTIAKGTALSGTVAGAEYIPEGADEERAWEALKGAGFGFAASSLANIAPAMANFFKKRMKAAFNTKFAKEGAQLADDANVELSATQLTDDPFVRTMQQTAEGTIKGQRVASDLATRQISQTQQLWKNSLKKISKVKAGVGRMVTRAFEKTLGSSSKGTGLRGARRKQADIDFKLATQTSRGAKIIRLDNFKNKASKLINEWRNSADKTEQAAAREIVKVLRPLSRRSKDGKRIYEVSAKKMQNLLQTYGRTKTGRGSVLGETVNPSTQQKFADALFGQLQKDLDSAIKSGVKGAKELKIARDNYRVFSKEIDRITDSALGAILTKSAAPKGMKLEKRIMALEPDDLKSAIRILRRSDPQMPAKLQRLHVESLLKESGFRTTAAQPNFKPGKMLDLDKGRNKEFLNALFEGNKSGLSKVKRGLDITERIMMDNAKAGGNRLMTHLTQAAGVAASMDRTFQARLVTELLTPRLISRYIQTGEGLKALLTLSKPYNAGKYAAALIKLNNIRKEEKDGN